MDKTSLSLLDKILKENMNNPKGVNAFRFRAAHHEHLDLLDKMESYWYIEKRNGNYFLKVLALSELKEVSDDAKWLIDKCEVIFKELRQLYLECPEESISLNRLVELTDISRQNTNICLIFMVQALLFGSWTNDFFEFEDAYVAPAEQILRYNNFYEVLEEIRSWQRKRYSSESVEIETIDDFRFLLHPIIIEKAWRQYNDGHLRDAVLNSIIAVFDYIRDKTGLNEDGVNLVGKAFSLQNPYLILNNIDTESGQNDQKGFIQLLQGAYQSIRNPKAHSLINDLNKLKTAQYLVFASLLVRRIDEATVVERKKS